MNDAQDKQVQQIARDEAWLADLMRRYPEPPPRGLDNLKLVVRVTAQGRVLDEAATPPPSERTIHRVKQAVRAELSTRAVGARRGFGRWRTVWGTLAAAAAVAFWFVPVHVAPSAPADGPDVMLGDFVAVLTSGDAAGEPKSWTDQINTIESDIRYVEDLLVSEDAGWDDYQMDDLQTLDEQIDELLDEAQRALDARV